MLHSALAKVFLVVWWFADIGKQQICSGGSTDFTYPPTSPDVTTTTDQSPVPVSPSLSSLNYGDSSLPCSPAPVSPVTVTSSTRDACGAAATATQVGHVSVLHRGNQVALQRYSYIRALTIMCYNVVLSGRESDMSASERGTCSL